jgi:alpha,alpha-trehalase
MDDKLVDAHGTRRGPFMIVWATVARLWLCAAVAAIAGSGSAVSLAAEMVVIDRSADLDLGADTVRDSPELPPILKACLFGSAPIPSRISPRTFALQCVVPYIHGLWLDPTVLYRGRAHTIAQAQDKLVTRPAGQPFPIFYPSRLGDRVTSELQSELPPGGDIVLKPLPEPLPTPSLASASVYNNIGLLYLPNPYAVPGDTFNEMYGWDSFFIIKGLLASVDHVMRNPTTRVWSTQDQTFYQLNTDANADHYYRAFAQRLFETAKGMVDNHIFQIEYYGGFVLNANRTYYLTRSQPPLFTQAALAVLRSASLYGFDYKETLAPYLGSTDPDFVTPLNYQDWIRLEVLPASRRYYAYWTNPSLIPKGFATNPRVAEVTHRGETHPVYLYGTDGIGPAPEVARSTQPQNRQLYEDYATYFKTKPAANPGHRFYNPDHRCTGTEPVGDCGDPTYGLTQAFYAADRAIRASGFDLSGRFGEAGEWALHYAPLCLNVLLLHMAEDIDELSTIVGEPAPHGEAMLQARRRFLADFFARETGDGYGDRFASGDLPANVNRFAYPYATQLYLLWADVLRDPGQAKALVARLQQAGTGGPAFLAPPQEAHFGIPSSLIATGEQWDAPFAWAPVQYFAVEGLIGNAFPLAAATVMAQWIAAVHTFFAKTGLLIEKYDFSNPTNDPRARVGYAHAQRGFGWTNAVYLLFVNRLYQG